MTGEGPVPFNNIKNIILYNLPFFLEGKRIIVRRNEMSQMMRNASEVKQMRGDDMMLRIHEALCDLSFYLKSSYLLLMDIRYLSGVPKPNAFSWCLSYKLPLHFPYT